VLSFVNNLARHQYLGICEPARFVPLRPSTGNLTMVVSPCDNTPPSQIDIVDRTASGFEYREIADYRTMANENAARGVQDILGNGNFELIIDTQLGYVADNLCLDRQQLY
jgi:hypothetical protein